MHFNVFILYMNGGDGGGVAMQYYKICGSESDRHEKGTNNL